MCGLVGVSLAASRHLNEALLDPIQRLEYRGYDSCGVIYRETKGKRVLLKHVGDVSSLKADKPARKPLIKSGLAHTRWATHGAVSVENTHPQESNGLYVVHNGVIDNYEELKVKLIAQGYVFASQTDTEVIAHLVHSHVALGYSLVTSVSSQHKLNNRQTKELSQVSDG